MMKFITSIAAFSLAFFLSVALIGFPQDNSEFQIHEIRTNIKTQQNIGYFLSQDIANGNRRDRKIYENGFVYDPANVSSEYAEIINEYADASGNLDASQLPADFQLAWQNHMKAWRTHAVFLNRSKHFCKMQTMNQDKKDHDLSEVFARQDLEITRTWYEVLAAADKYGATIALRYR